MSTTDVLLALILLVTCAILALGAYALHRLFDRLALVAKLLPSAAHLEQATEATKANTGTVEAHTLVARDLIATLKARLHLAPAPAGVAPAATFPAPIIKPEGWDADTIARLAAYNPTAHPGVETDHLAALVEEMKALRAQVGTPADYAAGLASSTASEPTATPLVIADPAPTAPATVAVAA